MLGGVSTWLAAAAGVPLRTTSVRVIAACLLVGAVALAGAPNVYADGAASAPQYDSVIRSVEPELTGLEVRVVEGDDALELRNRTGERLEIAGYDDEPYLRFEADGTVVENVRSPTKYTNEDRYGLTPLPRNADSDAAPRWVSVSSNGRYEWHDHRIHWMSKERPEEVKDPARRTKIFDWVVPIRSESARVRVAGTLFWDPEAHEESAASNAAEGLPLMLLGAIGSGLVLVGWGFARTRRRRMSR